jgi:hypothetical protein
MRLSLCFMGIAPIASTLPAVLAAQRSGLDGVSSAEHIGGREPWYKQTKGWLGQ